MVSINKLNKLILITLNCICLICSVAIAEENANVAKAIIVRGQVKAKMKDGSVVDVKIEQDFKEGTIIQTSDKSFVKLIFVDKSQMNIGPSSQLVINSFPKAEAGILTLVKGQIRSQVTKDYMDISDKSKSKLFIKTTTAAMGIRGTDFQVNYNPENQNTALITFEGAVAMSNIDKKNTDQKLNQTTLEKIVSNEKSVMVGAGHVSAINLNVTDRAMIPTKLSPSQINALKNNETGLKENSNKEEKMFRNPIPPGTEGTSFTNQNSSIDKIAEKNVSKETLETANANNLKTTQSDANGFFNNKTGEYKLPAGSIIDLKTVNIIPPPTNAVYDNNTNTYKVPDNFGKVDPSTGDYRAPEGVKLGHDGKFIIVDPDAYTKAQEKLKVNKSNDEGSKNSETKNSTSDSKKTDEVKKTDETLREVASNPTLNNPLPSSITEIRNDLNNFAQIYSTVVSEKSGSTQSTTNLQTIAEEKKSTTETTKQNNSNTAIPANATKTKVIFK